MIKANKVAWSGFKPQGIHDIKIRGKELSATISAGRD